MLKTGSFPFAQMLLALAGACALSTILSCGGSGSSGTLMGDTVITEDTVWENKTIRMSGTLTISPGARLTMNRVNLRFEPELEDTGTVVVQSGTLIANNCDLRSGSGRQWNLEAYGASTLTFTGTTATDHAGIRAFDTTMLTVDHCQLEEVQCHDNAFLDIKNGSGVYIVLFFEDTGSVSFASGVLASGDDITREFTYKSTGSATGHVRIASSDVWGFQLDIVGATDLTVTGGTEIVLALHLTDVVKTVTDSITSAGAANGAVDFSPDGGPKFTYTSTQISYINVYLNGNGNVTFSGTNRVVECNVWDNATLSFGAGTTLLADLAQAYDSATLNLNGVTLADDGSSPSITAEGSSVVNIGSVNAISGTYVCAAGNGKVNITGGTGWNTNATLEELDAGIITRTP